MDRFEIRSVIGIKNFEIKGIKNMNPVISSKLPKINNFPILVHLLRVSSPKPKKKNSITAEPEKVNKRRIIPIKIEIFRRSLFLIKITDNNKNSIANGTKKLGSLRRDVNLKLNIKPLESTE